MDWSGLGWAGIGARVGAGARGGSEEQKEQKGELLVVGSRWLGRGSKRGDVKCTFSETNEINAVLKTAPSPCKLAIRIDGRLGTSVGAAWRWKSSSMVRLHPGSWRKSLSRSAP